MIFLISILSIWGALHAYVFWRLTSLPWLMESVSPLVLAITAFFLWSSYLIARVLDAKGWQTLVWPLEYAAATWVGFLFLLFWSLLVVEVVTLGGVLFSAQIIQMRTGAIVVAGMLSVIALIQGRRPPAVTEHEVQLDGLPQQLNGTVLLQLSDLHLGNLLGRRWLSRLLKNPVF